MYSASSSLYFTEKSSKCLYVPFWSTATVVTKEFTPAALDIHSSTTSTVISQSPPPPPPARSPRWLERNCALHSSSSVSVSSLKVAAAHKLTRHTSCTRVQGDTRGEVPRQTAGVTKLPMVGVVQRGGKDGSSVTWYSGTPVPGGPLPPHWVDATPHW